MAPRLKYLPVALSKTLMPFQQEGVLFGISKNGRCLIGDEMGLGKTLQALSIAYYYKDEWPLLIVCPSSMRFPWIEEIEKWLPDVQPGDINLVLSGTDVSEIKNCKITLVGYGLLSCASSRLLINSLKDTKFGVVIVDESHYMKNRKATRTKALVDIIRNAERAILLTGTPALARPEELYVQIEVLKPKLVGTFAKFATRYCEAHTEYICGGRIRKWNTQGASNLDELHRILKENVMVRRLKRNVLTQLPPKRRQKISFDIAESECKKDLTELIKDFRNINKQIHGCASNQTVSPDRNPLFEMHRLATQLYKQTGLSKVPAVRQYIADMLENTDKKFLVFSHHLEMQKAIELEVIKKKVKYIRIAGDVPSIFRGALVNQFQNDSDVRVAILSLLAASVGLTLTAADHVIFAELHWTPGVMEQAEDRVHRIGQENSVLVQYLVAKGTIDEVLWRMLNSKVYVTSATLNGETRGMDVEEGSEGQSKLLEAFSAWVEEEEEAEEEEFLFTMSQKKRKQDAMQRSLTEFFHSPSSAKSPKCRKTDNGKQFNTSRQPSEDGDADIVWLEKSQLCAEEPREITPKSAKDDTVISVEGIQSTHGATKMPLVSLEKTPFTRVVEKIGTDTNSAIVSEKIDGLSKNKMASGIVVVDLTSESNTSHDTKCLQIGENNSDSNSKDNNSDAEINNKNLSAIKEKKKRVKRSSFEKDLNDFKSEPWICSVCTLENNAFLTLCEMCDTPRQISRRKTKTMLSTQEFIKRKQQKLFDNCSEPAKPKKGRKAVCKRKGAKRKTVNTGDGDVHICYSTDNKQEIDKGIPGNTGLNMGSTGAKMDLTLIKDDEDEISGVNRAHQVQIGAFSDNNRCGEKSGEFETVRVDIGICENGDVHKGNEEILSDCEKGGHGIILDNQVHEGGTGTLKHLAEFGNIDEKEIESNPNGYNDKSRILGDNAVQTTSEVMDIGNDTRTDATDEGEVDIIGDNNVHGTIIGKTENKMEVVERDNTDEIDTDPLTNIDSPSTGCGAIPQEDISEPVDASDSDARTVRDELQTTDADDLGSDELFSSTADECDDVTTPGDPWTCDVCGTPNSSSLNACAVCGEQRGTAYGGDLVTNMDDDYWRCEDCGELCLDDEGAKKCRQCAERHEKAREAFVKNWRHLSYLLTDDNEGDKSDEGISGTIGNMMYCMSPFTDRVYLYRENGDPLACNVSLHDLDACGKSENLPVVLKNAENRKQVLRFLRKWKSLPERQKRSVKKSGLVFEDPYQVAEAIKMGNEKLCISRHPTKEKLQKEIAITAEEKNGSVRMCTKIRKQRKQGSLNDPKKLNKNNNSNERTWVQAVDQNGCPLCISCQAVVNTSNTDCEWDERFCSHKCKENYQIRLSGTCVRSKLFEEERGVCQKCSLDAHGLYRSLLLLPKADRRAYLENTPFLTLPVTLLNKIIIDPKEGMFWEADHVIPVVEGGGECGLDNYRTLCVPCHRQVTAELRDRIKLNRQKTRTAGIPDISTFFKP